MNKISLLLATITLGLTTLTPGTADARDFSCGTPRTRITHDSCGRTLHWEFRFSGFDCHRKPIFRWVLVRTCAAPRPVCGTGHGGYVPGRGGYTPGRGSYSPGRDDRAPSRGDSHSGHRH